MQEISAIHKPIPHPTLPSVMSFLIFTWGSQSDCWIAGNLPHAELKLLGSAWAYHVPVTFFTANNMIVPLGSPRTDHRTIGGPQSCWIHNAWALTGAPGPLIPWLYNGLFWADPGPGPRCEAFCSWNMRDPSSHVLPSNLTALLWYHNGLPWHLSLGYKDFVVSMGFFSSLAQNTHWALPWPFQDLKGGKYKPISANLCPWSLVCPSGPLSPPSLPHSKNKLRLCGAWSTLPSKAGFSHPLRSCPYFTGSQLGSFCWLSLVWQQWAKPLTCQGLRMGANDSA